MPIYMDIDGVRGDVSEARGGGDMHIESFSWGESQLGAAASHFDGRLLTARDLTDEQAASGGTFKEFTVTKKTDTATAGEFPYIVSFQDAASGSEADAQGRLYVGGDAGVW